MDDDGKEVVHDGAAIGEIVVRGNVVMAGYYNDPEATALAFRGGVFHTGDAAVVHPDGYVEIRDRIKDVIISGGENVSSVEVEGVLLRHPAVFEVAGRRNAGRTLGRSAARVRRAAPRRERGRSGVARVRTRQHGALQSPEIVSFRIRTPKNGVGKIQKYVLRGSRAAVAAQ